MFASIRKYKTDKPGLIIPQVRKEFLPLLQQVPGFISYYLISSEQDSNEVISVSIFENKESAEVSNTMALEWIQRNDIAMHLLNRVEVLSGQVSIAAEVGIAH
jgi:hypothetical protein